MPVLPLTMHRVARLASAPLPIHAVAQRVRSTRLLEPFQKCSQRGVRFLATTVSQTVPDIQTVAHIEAPRLGCANDPGHVRRIAEQLQLSGLLKISLQFADDDSAYLQQLLVSLHENHGHRLPIAHSATRGWFWDVRPSDADFQAGSHQARSETMDEFPWHTDCSYEDPLPRYFALQVLQHDRFGGGTLSVINVERLSRLLSSEARAALARPEYQISVPPEFIKDPTRRTTTGSLLAADATGRAGWMRFRQDIVAPVSERASGALEELKEALHGAATEPHSTVHLTADELPARSIILVDNRRWLHSRSHVRDPDRHLRRVRWDAIPFHPVPT